MGIALQECKKRWKSLRDSYKRCKRMDQLASGSIAETPRKKWRYFESLSFLENVSNSRRTIGSISADDTQFIEESEVVEIVDINSANISPPAIESPQSKVLNPREQKKKDSDKFQKFLEMAGSSISETCAAFVGQRQMQDSTALHFASLAAKISEDGLPPNTVNQIEAKVSVLVFGEIEKYLSASMESTVE
ncbi:PREDICTED: uncharacterized protein LOC108380759 [Rhagoletis zephyria]|uniref:uncharacterized protein LOC108380759 n=1 Tax=Rhagoletis zephyria TaxID=28612 RepID=UPI0008116F02|nr:PREDICTED: uncharacterized protein LOC108380759 [Rhagoletis zephyria]